MTRMGKRLRGIIHKEPTYQSHSRAQGAQDPRDKLGAAAKKTPLLCVTRICTAMYLSSITAFSRPRLICGTETIEVAPESPSIEPLEVG